MPAVSVVIPVYNVEKYLGACLDSVLRQTLTDIEIICVDDGSTDGSPALLAAYAARDPRLRVLTQPNAGLSAARNAGLDAATGRYIYFLDSDDWIADDALATCLALCERDNLDQLIFGCRVHADADAGLDARRVASKQAVYATPPAHVNRPLPGADLLTRLLRDGGYFCAVQMRFFRLSVLKAGGLRFPEGLLHEDEYFTPLSLVQARTAELVPAQLMMRRLRANSITTAATPDDKARRCAHTMVVLARLRTAARARRGADAAADAALARAIARVEDGLVARMGRTSRRRAFHLAARLPGAPNRWRLLLLLLRTSLRLARLKRRRARSHP